MFFKLNEEIKRYPFIRITLPLVLGIVIGIYLSPNILTSVIITVLSIILFTIAQIKSLRSLTGISINIVFISLGLILTTLKSDLNNVSSLNDYDGYIIGEIYEDPKPNEKTTSLKIEITALKHDDEWVSTSGKTILYIENDERTDDLQAGDQIIFNPHLSEIENSGNPEEFDYKKYLSYNMIYNSDFLSSDEWNVIKSDYSSKLNIKLLRFRQNLISQLKEHGMSNDELAVVSALALGYKDQLSDEIRHAYASSGAMHILAVSGLHVGIIYGILVFLFSFIKNDKLKIPKTVLIIVFIWLYALMTGLSPSVSRAALMFSIMSLGLLQNKSAGSLNAIAFSAFILLIINPYNITNIGFQLSYAAVIGIVILYPKIYSIFEVKNKYLDKVWALTAVSVSAQIATAPIAIFYFHQFSNYFILANYLLIPISTLAIWTCILVFTISGLGIPAGLLIKVLTFLVKSMNSISIGIESLPFSVSNNLYINTLQLVLLYFIIISLLVFFFQSKNYKHLFQALVGIIVFTGFNLFSDIQSNKQQELIIYNINKATAINIIDGKYNILFANLDSISNDKIKYTAQNNLLKKGLNEEKYINLSNGPENILSDISTIDNKSVFFKQNFIAYQNTKIFIANNNFFPAIFTYSSKIKVDYIVLSNNTSASISDLVRIFDFKKIIIDSSNDAYILEEWLKENEELGIYLYNIKSQGAFITNL